MPSVKNTFDAAVGPGDELVGPCPILLGAGFLPWEAYGTRRVQHEKISCMGVVLGRVWRVAYCW